MNGVFAAADTLWRWVSSVNTRIAVLAVAGGIVFQQHQIAQAQAQIQLMQAQIVDVRDAVEAQLTLTCSELDSVKLREIRLTRLPCQKLFDKYGIAR